LRAAADCAMCMAGLSRGAAALRAGLTISVIGHSLLAALLLTSNVVPLQATNTATMTVDLVPADRFDDAAGAAAPGEPSPAEAQPPTEAAQAQDTPIRAPEVAEGLTGAPQPSRVRSASAGGMGDIEPLPARNGASSAPAPGQNGLGQAAGIATAAGPSTLAAPARQGVDAPRAARPPGAGSGSREQPEAPQAQAQPQPQPRDPKQPAADPSWNSVLAEMPVIVAGEPPRPPTGRVLQEVAALKAHLKKCWKLRGDGGDDAAVIRVFLQSNGALGKEPMLLVAPASSSGPALVLAAMRALKQCQPFAFLPAAKYKDWKELDLRFTAGEMAGG
jgi:hypothetical protein